MIPLIECQQLSKSYAGRKALHDVSFSCEAGAPIALIGPNGAGKTTLFSILCDYFRPTSGSVKILGLPPGHKDLRGQIAALPQDAQFDPSFTIGQQLRFYAQLQGFNRKEAMQETERVLSLMDLQDNLHSLPASLSHGMRKRAAIAQALIGNPKLVLLDEPTAGLDPANAKNIRQQISAISSDTTFVISSHNIQELERLCQSVLYLNNGQLSQQTLEDETGIDSYLTVHMTDSDRVNWIAAVNNLAGVKEVHSDQKNEYLIRYDETLSADLDQQLLKLMAEQKWRYRQLIKGKTLEEKLFS